MMIERFKTSVSYPRLIGQFITDKKSKIFLYMILISLICLLPVLIRTIRTEGLSNSAMNDIQNNLYEKKEKIPAGSGIENYKLNTEEETVIDLGLYKVFFNTIDNLILELAEAKTAVLLDKEKVTIFSYGIDYNYSYEELGIENLDFADLVARGTTEYDIAYVKITTAIDFCMEDMSSFWKPMAILMGFITFLSEYFMVALMLALIFRIWNPFPYKLLLRLSIYACTMTMLFILIGELFSLYYLFLIGLGISAFYLSRALRSISIIKVKKEDEVE